MAPFKSSGPSNRRKLIAAGVVLALAVIAFLAVRDWMTYRRLVKENGELTQKIARERRRRDVELPQARDHLIDLEDEQEKFRYHDRLPDEDRLEELFDRFSEFEEVSGLDWVGSDSKERRAAQHGVPAKSYKRIQYTFDIRGEFFQLCKYVNLLENMVRFATIDEFTIKRARKGRRPEEDEGQLMCEVKLIFSVYALPSASPASQAPAAQPGGGVRTARVMNTNVDAQVRRMMGFLAGGLAVLVLAAQVADAVRPPAGRPTPKPGLAPKSLREFLTEPLFEFARTKDGLKRRDPFLIPLHKIPIIKDASGTEVPPEIYKQRVAAEVARLKKLQEDLGALKAAVGANDGPTALTVYQRLDAGLQQDFGLLDNEKECDRLRREFAALQPRISRVLVEAALVSAREKVAAIQAAFAARRYDEVGKLASEFDTLSDIPAAKESPQWKALQAQVINLQGRAKAHIDFKTKEIRISSIIVSRHGGVAVINGKTCTNGSRLDEDTIVASITHSTIVFVYSGEQIEYRFGS